jgi:hypothetical protein
MQQGPSNMEGIVGIVRVRRSWKIRETQAQNPPKCIGNVVFNLDYRGQGWTDESKGIRLKTRNFEILAGPESDSMSKEMWRNGALCEVLYACWRLAKVYSLCFINKLSVDFLKSYEYIFQSLANFATFSYDQTPKPERQRSCTVSCSPHYYSINLWAYSIHLSLGIQA